MRDIRKKEGAQAELVAAAFLKERGIRILQKNFRCRYGEIDLIAKEGKTYLVVEVKYRRFIGQGSPAEAVDFRKQGRICLTYDYYRMRYHLDEFVPVRFDVIEVDSEGHCHWIQNAFDYIELQ